MPKMSNFGVVGAGLAGVTTARALAYLGFTVDLFESRTKLTGSLPYGQRNVVVDTATIELIRQLDTPLYKALQSRSSQFFYHGVRTPQGEMELDVVPTGTERDILPSYMLPHDSFLEASLFTSLPDPRSSTDPSARALDAPCLPLHLGKHVVGLQQHVAKAGGPRPEAPLSLLWTGAGRGEEEAPCHAVVAADGPCGAAAAIAHGKTQAGGCLYASATAREAGLMVHGALPLPAADVTETDAGARGRLLACAPLSLDNGRCFTTAHDGVALTAVVGRDAVCWRMTVAPARIPAAWAGVSPLVGLGQPLHAAPAVATGSPPSRPVLTMAEGPRPPHPGENAAETPCPPLSELVGLLDRFPEHLRALVADTPAEAVAASPILERPFSTTSAEKFITPVGTAVHSVLPYLFLSDSAAIEDALTLALTINQRLIPNRVSSTDDIGACFKDFRSIRAPRAEKVYTASKSADVAAEGAFWSALSRFARRYERSFTGAELTKEYKDLHGSSPVPSDLLDGLKLNRR